MPLALPSAVPARYAGVAHWYRKDTTGIAGTGIILFSPVTVNFGSAKDNRSVESLYRGHRFPPAIFLYHRFTLSFRDVDDLLAERGVIVSYEAPRLWCRKFGSPFMPGEGLLRLAASSCHTESHS